MRRQARKGGGGHPWRDGLSCGCRVDGFGSRRGGAFRKIVFFLAFLLSSLGLLWMLFLPTLIRFQLEARTDFPMSIEGLGCNPFGLTLRADGWEIRSPERYGVERFMNIESLVMDVELKSLETNVWRGRSLDLRIDELTLVRDEQGRVNLNEFLAELMGQGGPTVRLDRASLSLGTLRIVDYAALLPMEKTLRVGRTWELRDLEDAWEVFAPIRTEAARAGLRLDWSRVAQVQL